jgi:hypothetical protein
MDYKQAKALFVVGVEVTRLHRIRSVLTTKGRGRTGERLKAEG